MGTILHGRPQRVMQIPFWVVSMILLSSCVFNVTAVPNSDSSGVALLTSGQTFGQTFVSQNAGLNGIEFFIDETNSLEGNFVLRLREKSQSSVDIVTTTVQGSDITEPGYFHFEFPPQSDSFRKYYYVFLELEGEGNVWFRTAPGNEYLNGAQYTDHHPLNQQSVFKLTYHPGFALLDFSREVLYWCVVLIVATFLFVLPGLSIVTLGVSDSSKMNWSSRLAIGVAISLCLYPILFLLTYLLGIKLGPILAWTPGILGLIILGLKSIIKLRTTSINELYTNWRRSTDLLPDLVAVLVTIAIIFTRFFITRVVDLPLWGDSLTHSMVSQLIVDNDGLFQSWAPYAELDSLTYHFGFHTFSAVFNWITTIPIPQSTLWVGQIINIIAVLSLYPVASRLGKSKWAGVGSIVIAGLVLSLPQSYVNWGRYTQLAGQAILPAVILVSWWLREKGSLSITPAVMLGTLMGGLGLVHYRVLVFAIALILVLVLDQLIRSRQVGIIYNFTISTVIGSAIFLPWFSKLLGGNLLGNAVELASTPANSTSAWIQQYNTVGDLSVYLPLFVWIFLIASSGWAVIKRKLLAITIINWWLLLLLLGNPQILGLPGQGILSNFAIFIAFYIPAALLIGGAIGWLLSQFQILRRVIPILLILIAVLGGLLRLEDLQPQKRSLAARPDIHAWAWINNHLPPNTKFLTNSFFAYGGSIIVGSDGGWWLPLMTSRQSNLPPINYGTEKGPRTDNIPWQNELTHQLQRAGLEDERTLEMLQDRGITHVYIGQQQGSVNSSGSMRLDPEKLEASPHFRSIYHFDRVWIFEFIP